VPRRRLYVMAKFDGLCAGYNTAGEPEWVLQNY